jgi:ABC-type phosphate transport system auxiliary subunit
MAKENIETISARIERIQARLKRIAFRLKRKEDEAIHDDLRAELKRREAELNYLDLKLDGMLADDGATE